MGLEPIKTVSKIPVIEPVVTAAFILCINVPSKRLPIPPDVKPDNAAVYALLAISCQKKGDVLN